MKDTKKLMTTSLLMALMCAAAATMASAKPVKANGQLAVRDVLTADISKDVTGRYVKRQADVEAMNVVSDVKAQISDAVEGKRHIRFVAAIDSHKYADAKFDIVVKDGDTVVKTFADKAVTTAYTHIEANGEVLSAAEAFGEGYNYMIAYTINNVPEAAWGYTFEVTASIKTADATEFTVSDVAVKAINKVAFDDAIGAGVVDIVNDALHPWAMEMVDGVATMTSTNGGVKSTEATITFTAKKDTVATFNWYVSSERNYDYLNVKVGTIEVVKRQGDPEGVNGFFAQKLSAGETISFTYRKDSSGDKGEDKAVITNLYFTDGIPAVGITKVVNDGVTPNATSTGALMETLGSDALVAPENVRGDNYAFDAWYYDAEFTKPASAEDVLTKEAITLYANWKEKAVINFVVPEGVAAMDPLNVWTYEALDVANPVKDKHIFRGWYLDANFENPIDLANGVVESCTVYAKFEELPVGAMKESAHVISFEEGQHEWKVNATTTEEFQTYYFEFTPEETDKYIFNLENYNKVGGDASYAYYNRMSIEKTDGTVVESDFNGKVEVVLEAGVTYYGVFHGSKYYPQYTSWGTFDLTVNKFDHDTIEEAIPMTVGTDAEIAVGTFVSKHEVIVYKYEATQTTGLRYNQESTKWARVQVYEGALSGSTKLSQTTGTSASTMSVTGHIDVEAGKTYYFVVANNWNDSEMLVGEVKFGLEEYAKGYTVANPNEYTVGETLTTNFEGGATQYFAFEVENEDVYKLSSNGGQSGYTKNIQIYATSDLSKVVFSASGADAFNSFAKLPAGNYVMKINYTAKDGVDPFNVALTVAEVGETILKPASATLPAEPGQVAEITAGGYYTFTTGDEAVFHFFSTDDTLVVIEITDVNGNVVATSVNGTVYAKLEANKSYVLHVDAAAVVNHHTEGAIHDGKSKDTAFVYADVTQLNNDESIAGKSQEVWFEFTADEAGTYVFYTLNNGTIDTKGWVYDESNTQIGYNDDGGNSLMTGLGGYKYDFYVDSSASKQITLEAGEKVYIKITYTAYTSNTAQNGISLNFYITKL